MRRIVSKFWLFGFLLLMTCLDFLPEQLKSFIPDSSSNRAGPYWLLFLIRDLNRYLPPVVATMLLLVPCSYCFYRPNRWIRHRHTPEVKSKDDLDRSAGALVIVYYQIMLIP